MKSITLNPFTFLPSPDYVMPVALSSGVGQTFDMPTGAAVAAFALNADFWVTYGSTGATAPSTSSTGSSGSELNPTVRHLGSTAVTTGVTIYSDVAAKGHIAWFKP